MARSQDVSVSSIREAVRHLAPYVGYPTAAEALMPLAELEGATEHAPDAQHGECPDLDATTLQRITTLDTEFGGFFQGQFTYRWGGQVSRSASERCARLPPTCSTAPSMSRFACSIWHLPTAPA
jgi:hypothetical protein